MEVRGKRSRVAVVASASGGSFPASIANSQQTPLGARGGLVISASSLADSHSLLERE